MSYMTYNVFGGTLNLAQPCSLLCVIPGTFLVHCDQWPVFWCHPALYVHYDRCLCHCADIFMCQTQACIKVWHRL